MKVLHIFAYFGTGGAEDQVITLTMMANQNGVESLIYFDQIAPKARQRLKDLNIKTGQINLKSSFNPLKIIQSARQLKKIVKLEKVRIVHAHMLREHSVAIVAKLMGAKFRLVRTFHRFDQFNYKMRPLLPLYRYFTDAFIAISGGMAEYMSNNGISNRVWIVNNGVLPVEANKHDNALGFIGRLVPEKGIYQFIKQNQELLKHHTLVVAGSGPDSKKIDNLVKEAGLKVKLLGNIDNKTEFFEQISVLVLPSSTDVLPLVVLEAFSCGLPVVAFNVDYLEDLVVEGSGGLVEFGAYKELAGRAVELMNKYSTYSGFNRKLYRDQYSSTAMWRGVSGVYKSVLASNRH